MSGGRSGIQLAFRKTNMHAPLEFIDFVCHIYFMSITIFVVTTSVADIAPLNTADHVFADKVNSTCWSQVVIPSER